MTAPDPTVRMEQADLDAVALLELAQTLRDGGYAFRAHAHVAAIEVKGQHTGHVNVWHLLPVKMASGQWGHFFASTAARDAVLRLLEGAR